MTERAVSASPWPIRLAILASIALSGAAIVGVVLDRLEALSAPVPSVRGLRLGATPEEVRAVRPGGGWTTRVDQTGDLELSRDGESYWFHEGLLVLLDVTLAPTDGDAAGPQIVTSPGSVLAREPVAGAVRVRLVSRTCPTHEGLARSLLAGPER